MKAVDLDELNECAEAHGWSRESVIKLPTGEVWKYTKDFPGGFRVTAFLSNHASLDHVEMDDNKEAVTWRLESPACPLEFIRSFDLLTLFEGRLLDLPGRIPRIQQRAEREIKEVRQQMKITEEIIRRLRKAHTDE